MYYLYILKSKKNNRTYVGISDDVQRRIKEHNQGKSIYTSRNRPWKLIHTEECITREEARKREKYYKSGAGRRFIEKRIYNIT